MAVKMTDFDFPTGNSGGGERDLIGQKRAARVRQAGETNAQMQDGFSQKKGTGPRKATQEYGGPKLRVAHQPDAGGSEGLDRITTNPTNHNPGQTNDGSY